MLIEKFEEAVEAFSECIAIKMEAETFTYRKLNQYANQVAAQITASFGLSNKGKQAALLFEHGADMIIGLIAALKANMVYVPLDRTYPENRYSMSFHLKFYPVLSYFTFIAQHSLSIKGKNL